MSGRIALGLWSWSLCSGTLVIVGNGSTIEAGDMIIDAKGVDSAWTHISAATMLSLTLLGYHLLGSIHDYLNSKPLGQESLMDIPNKLLFKLLQYDTSAWVVFNIRLHYVLDTGDLLAKIWMWPAFDFGTLIIFALGLNPIMQIILVNNPTMELPISDKTLSRILVGIALSGMGLMNLICHLCKCWPPSYYSARGLVPQFPLFQQIRDGIFLIQVIVCVAIRIYLKVKKSGPKPYKSTHKSAQILSNKVILFIFGAMIIGFSLFHVFGVSFDVTVQFGSIMFFNVFPFLLIFTNPSVKNHYLSRNRKVSDMLKYFQNSVKNQS